jgi:hypothetical protein
LNALQRIFSHEDRSIPGARLRQVRHRQKARHKGRKGINPFTNEPTTFKAKPTRKIIKLAR